MFAAGGRKGFGGGLAEESGSHALQIVCIWVASVDNMHFGDDLSLYVHLTVC